MTLHCLPVMIGHIKFDISIHCVIEVINLNANLKENDNTCFTRNKRKMLLINYRIGIVVLYIVKVLV